MTGRARQVVSGIEQFQQRWVRTRTFDYPSSVPQEFRVRTFRSLNLSTGSLTQILLVLATGPLPGRVRRTAPQDWRDGEVRGRAGAANGFRWIRGEGRKGTCFDQSEVKRDIELMCCFPSQKHVPWSWVLNSKRLVRNPPVPDPSLGNSRPSSCRQPKVQSPKGRALHQTSPGGRRKQTASGLFPPTPRGSRGPRNKGPNKGVYQDHATFRVSWLERFALDTHWMVQVLYT